MITQHQANKGHYMTATLSDIITQNTLNQSEGFPVGVPESWNWYKGWNGEGQETPPGNMTAVEGWAQVYREKGSTYENPNAIITVDNAKTWVRLKATKEWVLVQDQDKLNVAGGHFVTDFTNNAGSAMNVTKSADGSVSFKAPTSTYNDHFWFGARGTFSANTVDAVYTQYDMKVNDPNIKLVASVGADWWLNANAPYMQDHSTNPGVGSGNWIDLTTEYRTVGYFSLPTEEFKVSHPAVFGNASPTPSPVPTPTPTPTPDVPADVDFKPGDLKVTLSGDHYNGAPKAEVLVDGQSVGTVTVTADHKKGQWQDFVVSGNGRWADGADHTVTVKFLNDAFGGSVATDRNLYVDAVALDSVNNGQDWSYPVNGSHAWDFSL
jgi:Ca-dependent carbohydrate-binding module xylan-binding